MNEYLNNLTKIEFLVTYACTGKCKHCQEGEHTLCGESIDPTVAADAVSTAGSIPSAIISTRKSTKDLLQIVFMPVSFPIDYFSR